VQRNIPKRIRLLSSLSYAERYLALLDLELLELRRLRFDLIYYYKVFKHLTPFNPSDEFIVYLPDARCRSDLPYLQKPISKLPIVFYQFLFSEVVMPGIPYLLPYVLLHPFRHSSTA
jgi:hypothetical protein